MWLWQRKLVEIAVGFFMLAGIAALLLLALKVSGLGFQSFYAEDQGYPVAVMFNNAGGLKPKAKVTIAGVYVGRVKSIELNQDYIARVDLWLHKDLKIPEDTRASILTAGLLGDNFIGLTPGFSENNLKAGAIIPETQTDSAMVLEDLISKFVSGKASEQPAAKSNSNQSEGAEVRHDPTLPEAPSSESAVKPAVPLPQK